MHILTLTVNSLIDAKPPMASVLVMLADESIDINLRWENYERLVESKTLVRNRGYGDGFIDILTRKSSDELTMFDDFYVDRHQTYSFVQMYKHITEELLTEYASITQENIDAWRHHVMASGYSSFTHDW